MAVNGQPKVFKALLKCLHGGLLCIAGQDDAADVKPDFTECIYQTEGVLVIRDAEVAPHLIFFNIGGIDNDDNFRLVLHAAQHPHLAVRGKAGQYTGCMKIVKQLAAKFKIQLSAEGGNAFTNVLGLHFNVFIIVKANFIHDPFLFI